MSDSVIRVEGLGKRYRIGATRERYVALRDVLSRNAKALGQRLLGKPVERPKYEDFWALQDVSFEVQRGECVGVIGRNGAGKSTLLKLLSRITEPTKGRFSVRGRVASLLEVGTGFHPELTGRENIFLNGAILGMRREEIRRKFDEIVSFAEVEKFLDTPVKHYSSGMHARLAFAVAAHLEPEVLVVDEVLAVGDMGFQKKCLGKMGEVAKGGRTVLFVSHNMHAVNTLCDRGIVLRGGQVVFDGSAQESVTKYLELFRSAGPALESSSRSGSGEWRFTEAASLKPLYQPDEPKLFSFQVASNGIETGSVYLSGALVNDQGASLAQFDSRLLGQWVARTNAARGALRIDGLWLKPGRYSLDLYICSPGRIIDRVEGAVEFEVSQVLPYPQPASADAIAGGLVLADFSWQVQLTESPAAAM